MSPLLITLLIVAGICILIAIGYINHIVENNKLEKARLRADLSDRLRRCDQLFESFPGQLMSPALKLLLARLLLHYNQSLLALDKNNRTLTSRIEELREQIALGESISVPNLPQKVTSEAIAKDLRFQLENLNGQIVHGAQHRILSAEQARHWAQEIRHMLVLVHIELFTTIGAQALQQNHPGQARLAFERGVQYLRKQADGARYQKQLQLLERQLARTNAQVLQSTAPVDDEPNELADGLKDFDEDEWKKKNIYD